MQPVEHCDECSKKIDPFNRYTVKGEDGVYCSRLCRDGEEWEPKKNKRNKVTAPSRKA